MENYCRVNIYRNLFLITFYSSMLYTYLYIHNYFTVQCTFTSLFQLQFDVSRFNIIFHIDLLNCNFHNDDVIVNIYLIAGNECKWKHFKKIE